MLLIMIPDQYPNNYKTLEIYTGYFDSLDIMILFSYPSSIVIMRDYSILFHSRIQENVIFVPSWSLRISIFHVLIILHIYCPQ